MADQDVPISNHLTIRNGIAQYVRRVPEDVRDAFPFERIQKSLRTRDKRKARTEALALDEFWDARFAQARQGKGLDFGLDGPAPLRTEEWDWPAWQALATWFGASLAEDDWRARLGTMTGAAFGVEPDLSRLPWRSPEIVKEHIERGRAMRSITVADYVETRLAFVQSYVRRLGVSVSRTASEFERFMSACLTAELAYLDVFQLREGRRGGIGQPHPDTIPGPWKRAATIQTERTTAAHSIASPQNMPVGKTLRDCKAKWVDNREKVKKQVRPDYLREMEQSIAAFEAHSGVSGIGMIRRRDALAYRDHLSTDFDYRIGTVNKKIGFISGLMSTALNAGWIDAGLGSDLFLEVLENEDTREPYEDKDLEVIFSHPVFTQGYRFSRSKACDELQFWLPLFACVHGMISSEIIQIGPDTVGPHPDHPHVLCLSVTNAGDRRVKTLARRRWVPIRRELIDLGFIDLVEAARRDKRRWIWSAMDVHQGDVTRVSGYFSSFWASFSRDELEITRENTCLYSFRHGFQDRLSSAGHGDEIKKGLMGHTESGMTGRYGAKKKPRAVNIVELNEVVQSLPWPFLKGVRL